MWYGCHSNISYSTSCSLCCYLWVMCQCHIILITLGKLKASNFLNEGPHHVIITILFQKSYLYALAWKNIWNVKSFGVNCIMYIHLYNLTWPYWSKQLQTYFIRLSDIYKNHYQFDLILVLHWTQVSNVASGITILYI